MLRAAVDGNAVHDIEQHGVLCACVWRCASWEQTTGVVTVGRRTLLSCCGQVW
jgi:hypothetical protein